MAQAPELQIGDETRSLLDAVVLISAGLDLRSALDRLVQASCALTGARYGVLGLLDEDGVVADFVIHGVDQETIDRIDSLPTCAGVLGVLVEDPRPLRLKNVADDARALGFPPNHPVMSSFLGVPLLVDGAVFGNLYLTDKADGEQFTEHDQHLLTELARVAGTVVANARTHAASEQRHRWLEAGVELSGALQGSLDVDDALAQVAARIREVADADVVAVVADRDEGAVLVAQDLRDGVSEDRLGAVLEVARAAVRQAVGSGRVVTLPRAGQAVCLAAPLLSRLAPGHCLLVMIDEPGVGVDSPDPALLAAIAGQASLALDRTRALAERQEHLLVADRERIARDLHDTVIQRLFATGLQLQGLRRVVEAEEVKGRLDEAVAELNTTIRDIRSTIFELRHQGAGSLQIEIRALAKGYVPVLGFTPFVRITGPLDVAVPPDIAAHLVATMREALSNVARHAEADACIVEVDVAEGRLLLRISDNGRGIGPDVDESGLRNVRRRALDLGGSFRIAPEEPHGTLLEWQVPLAP